MTIPITSLETGDICFVNLDTDTIANEQRGSRPCIIISKQEEVRIVVVVPLTRTMDVGRFSYTMQIKKSRLNGLDSDSVAMIFQVRSISTARVEKKVGTLEDHYFEDMRKLLSSYLKLNSLSV
ncbi:MAG: type II toxin-antitoxin system PemK/MazF family toxin [Thermoplasmatales archaeon]|nr:type II toxin-antitoxin system PemK/MazF family toxin [Thermoplasmatales archaeon]